VLPIEPSDPEEVYADWMRQHAAIYGRWPALPRGRSNVGYTRSTDLRAPTVPVASSARSGEKAPLPLNGKVDSPESYVLASWCYGKGPVTPKKRGISSLHTTSGRCRHRQIAAD
jgi:hypothetical protein